MKRRVICILLSALVLFSLIPATALQASAASDMKTSEDCIVILKQMEGFVSKPVYDNGQYSVGYGSGCGKNEYPNGITEKEADALLREYLKNMEKSVNYFIDRYGLSLEQHQFDALMLFTYNVGANWINADGEFRKAVINGATGNDFIYPMTLWSNASSKLQLHLVRRRLAEANLYLNGVYSKSRPVNYTYVLFDNNGGVGNVSVQGYDATLAAAPKPTPYRSNYRFLGWYTAEDGGSWVTALDASTSGKTLYAHWQKGSGDTENGTAASYQRTASQISSLDIYKAPGSSETTGKLNASTAVKIVADYVDGSNVKWGKLETGGWVNLGNALTGVTTTHETQDPITVTVTNDYLNVRTGPSTGYSKVGTVNAGDKLEILETRLVGQNMWGRFSGGWVSLMYTDYETVVSGSDSSEPDATVLVTGTVTANSPLNIRSGAGTQNARVGTYTKGTKINIYEYTSVDGVLWGKTDKGWVCLTYVKLDGSLPEKETEPETDTGTESEPETKPETKPETESTEKAEGNGKVISYSELNIRSAPGTFNAQVGTYARGTRVTILEQKVVNGEAWGRTDKGWVCMRYIQMDEQTSENGLTGVVNANGLRVRSAAGTGSTVLDHYNNGDKVEILETTYVQGVAWGKTDKGWICLTYVTLSGSISQTENESKPETDTDSKTETGTTTKTSGVVTANGLRIRSAAGTGSTILGYYNNGDKVEILETTYVQGVAWGKTNKGWICLTYVKLGTSNTQTESKPEADTETDTKPETGTATKASGVVTTNGLRIRSAAGTASTILDYYNNGDQVEILETTYVQGVAWGRTDKGWVSMQYIQLDAELPQNSFSGVVNTNGLRIRSAAGTNSTVLDHYNNGDKVEILETTYVQGVAWGKTDKGWISLDYVTKT